MKIPTFVLLIFLVCLSAVFFSMLTTNFVDKQEISTSQYKFLADSCRTDIAVRFAMEDTVITNAEYNKIIKERNKSIFDEAKRYLR